MFAFIFAFALAAAVLCDAWLDRRQIHHVQAHRNAVPVRFAATVTLAEHQKAADYTIARTGFGMLHNILHALLVLALIFGGGIAALYGLATDRFGVGLWGMVAFFGAVALMLGIFELPFGLWRSFVIEERFGFNRKTWKTWLIDLLKTALLIAGLGLPVAVGLVLIMQHLGPLWWLWAWAAWQGFQLLLLAIFPTFIAPLFNKFEPLTDTALASRVEALLQRCGFASKGVFVMDGSKRSGHGNAYFTGFGAAKRIVLFDTLMQKLEPDEITAVLAHELGHFKRRHIQKRLIASFVMSFAFFALLGWLSGQGWFYAALGMGNAAASGTNPAVALVLLGLIAPAFTYWSKVLWSMTSRRHEFEADAFAATHADPNLLASSLVKLYRDNASTLTPDPLYSLVNHSHPTAAQRIERLVPSHAGG